MISFEEAIQIHELLILKFGGSAGLRDPETLKSALARPYQTLMEKFAILARVEAKEGKETEVLEFLKSALPLAVGEPGTIRWYALQMGPSTFGIFDTFETEDDRQAHLNGPIAAALMANAFTLLANDPIIEMIDLLAIK